MAAGAGLYNFIHQYLLANYSGQLAEQTILTVSLLVATLGVLFVYGILNGTSLFLKQKLNIVFLGIVALALAVVASSVAKELGYTLPYIGGLSNLIQLHK